MRTIINQNPDWIFIKEKDSALPAKNIICDPIQDFERKGWAGTDLPHTWNAQDGSDGGSDYDRTKGWYRKNMYIDNAHAGKKLYLEFGGAGTATQLYINGKHVPYSTENIYGTGDAVEYVHKGGYSRFRFDITDYVKYGESNLVAVLVDNTKTADIAPLDGDFNNGGGIYRDVCLVVTEPVHIDMMDHGADGVYLMPEKVTPVSDNTNTDFNLTVTAKIVNDSAEDKQVTVKAALRHPDHYDMVENAYIKDHLRFTPESMYIEGGQQVQPFETKTVTILKGGSYDYSSQIVVAKPRLWNGLEDPYQYEVAIQLEAGGELIEEVVKNIGFRYYEMPIPNQDHTGGGFYLNGKPYVLRGANKHQDWGRGEDALGFAITEEQRNSDAGIMYELGMNSVRLVHYQHDEKEIELYDKLGIIVWSELGLVDEMVAGSAKNHDAFMNVTKYQFTSLIKQQMNHPSVVIWGMANELRCEVDDGLKPVPESEMAVPSGAVLFEALHSVAKSIDPTRKTAYAAFSLFGRAIDWDSDSFAMNLYPYWYVSNDAALHGGNSSMTGQMKYYFGVPGRDGHIKPMGISEYGSSAVKGYTMDYQPDGTVKYPGDVSYTTTYQAYCHEKVYNEIVNELPFLWCSYVWQLFDSASDKKANLLKGTNDKGLVQYDHKTKKDAFYFYKANWNDIEPFAHIVNADRTKCASDQTTLRAYSNCDKLQLYVNGNPYGEPITDVNQTDGVVDGLGVFMWYDVPVTGSTQLEVKGVREEREVCSSVDTTGTVVFTR